MRWLRGVTASAMVCTCALGCGLYEQGCDLAGCTSGLQVHITPAPPAYRIEARSVPGSSPTPFVVECTGPTGCGSALFQDYLPARVQLRVIVAGRVRDTVAVPTYRVVQPNGERCGPTCRQAEITVPIP